MFFFIFSFYCAANVDDATAFVESRRRNKTRRWLSTICQTITRKNTKHKKSYPNTDMIKNKAMERKSDYTSGELNIHTPVLAVWRHVGYIDINYMNYMYV